MKRATTIYLEPELQKEAKKLAVDLGTSFSDLVAALLKKRLMIADEKKKLTKK